MTSMPRRFLNLALALVLLPAAGSAAEWNQFRGPARDGVSSETGLDRTWPEEGPPVVWRRALGEGFSGISAQGDTLYTLFAEGEEEYLARFDAKTGEELWRLEMGPTFHEVFGNGPRATPTIEGDTVYALGGEGRLVAADAATGEARWQVELTEAYGIYDPQSLNPMAANEGLQLPLYGYASSPLAIGELLVVMTGARHGRTLVAFDQATGEEVWTALDEEIGYSSPVVMELGGERQIITLPGNSIVSVSPEGELNWSYEWELTPSQPIFVAPDKIFVSTVSDVGALLLQVKQNGSEPEFEEIWRMRRLKNSWNSSIVFEGHLYGFDNATLRSVDLATGELNWATRGLGQGNLIFADGMLIALSDKGKLALIEPSPEEYRELANAQLLDRGVRSWTPPTLHHGVLYARNHEEMVAVDLRAGDPAVGEEKTTSRETTEQEP